MNNFLPLIIAIVVMSGLVGTFARRNMGDTHRNGDGRRSISIRASVVLDLLLVTLFAAGVFAKLFPAWILAIPVSVSTIGVASLVMNRRHTH